MEGLERDLPEGVWETVSAVLTERLGTGAFETLEVRAGEDHDGDPAVFIDVYHPLTSQPFDPALVYGLTSPVRTRLEELGEYRRPYIRHHFHEDQRVTC